MTTGNVEPSTIVKVNSCGTLVLQRDLPPQERCHFDIEQTSHPGMLTASISSHQIASGPKPGSNHANVWVAKKEQRHIAIVDDDEAVRDSLRFLLEVIGHPVQTFASAAGFLKVEMRHFAGLILDHNMPHMTGLELAERLRGDDMAIPILLVTGFPSPAIVARAAQLGIDRVLEKPLLEDDVLDFINSSYS
jgi:CheY-like chemotaxis protein